MSKLKINYLQEKIINILSGKSSGLLLDLGCGDGDLCKKMQDAGFVVTAADMDTKRFKYTHYINFKKIHLDNPLPFDNDSFDYLLFLEVLEHIYNPAMVLSEISRILKPGGTLILSTPNILSIRSRLRFLTEGSFDFFREPPLDYIRIFPKAAQNMHVIPWRYHELEYLLNQHDFIIRKQHVDHCKVSEQLLSLLLRPLLFLQSRVKEYRSQKKGGIDFRRIHKIILSPELLTGRHVIIEAEKRVSG